MPELTHSIETAAAVLSIIAGLFICFYGYKLLKFILGLTGFISGAFAGASIAYYLAGGSFWVIAGALIGGIIGALLFIFLFHAAIFILGAAIGAFAGILTASLLGLGEGAALILTGTAAIVLGIAALATHKFVIRFLTAIYGASLAASGIGQLVLSDFDIIEMIRDPSIMGDMVLSTMVILAITLVLGIAGTLYQSGVRPGKKNG